MTRTRKYHRCTSCDKVFCKQDHAHRHLKSHTISKPFQCDICTKRLKTARNLNEHMKTHIDDAKCHACPVCGRKFRRTHDVSRHQSVHRASQTARKALTTALSAAGSPRHTDKDEQMTGHGRHEDNAEFADTSRHSCDKEVDAENERHQTLMKTLSAAASARHTANHEKMAEHLSKLTNLL